MGVCCRTTGVRLFTNCPEMSPNRASGSFSLCNDCPNRTEIRSFNKLNLNLKMFLSVSANYMSSWRRRIITSMIYSFFYKPLITMLTFSNSHINRQPDSGLVTALALKNSLKRFLFCITWNTAAWYPFSKLKPIWIRIVRYRTPWLTPGYLFRIRSFSIISSCRCAEAFENIHIKLHFRDCGSQVLSHLLLVLFVSLSLSFSLLSLFFFRPSSH